jgi:dTDP-glucose 4,6-dehydratase
VQAQPEPKRAVVTGGAGFLGSHLADRLIREGWTVIVLDNLITGSLSNIEHLFGNPAFRFIKYDVTEYIHVDGPVDFVFHFASPASPVDFDRLPIQTLKVGALGTHKALGLAKAKGARFMLASTSEVYGDPLVHPQPEEYWGNVNPIGPRGVYDEAKRYAESLTMAYARYHGVDVRIVRLFNTYGPRMRMDDGRAVPNLLTQALTGKPLTIYGDGSYTRSFGYVDDILEGVWRLAFSDYARPMNIGSLHEFTMLELVEVIRRVTGTNVPVEHHPPLPDDPKRRQPDITKARTILGWEPTTPLEEGLRITAEDFRKRL